ncbi:MAG: orotate phosphoribosyltransferase [Gloeocapsa sp. DLM2.Bin57]|nr:MAG: orotate phosphoribosyltransferase [Gloeocapsa sp. DLM2.Bin57]
METKNCLFIAQASPTQLREILLELLCEYAYTEGDFVLSSGKSSSYYINGKEVSLRAEGALVIGRLLFSMLAEDTAAVAGLTLGADPLVTSVSLVSALENRPIPGLIIRKQAKGHGTQAYIEGPKLAANAQVVVLEDVVTTGASAMQAVERLRNVGYTVTEIIALVDRQQGGAEFYQSQGLDFRWVFSISDLQTRANNKP